MFKILSTSLWLNKLEDIFKFINRMWFLNVFAIMGFLAVRGASALDWREAVIVADVDRLELIHRTDPKSLICSESRVQQALVDKHNALRRKQFSMNMLKMQWDNEVMRLAERWANHCEYRHDSSSQRKTSKFSCGQNIARTWPQPKSWDVVIHMWYDEIKDFRYGNQPTGDVGHYTQLVWATSWQLGCAYADCGSFHYYVCDYCPAGNVVPSENMPFLPGPPCSQCLDSCDNGLCTNICPYEDKYSNCAELNSATFLCWDPFHPSQRSLEDDCAATCQCSSKIHQNNIGTKEDVMFHHMSGFPTKDFTPHNNNKIHLDTSSSPQKVFTEVINSQDIFNKDRNPKIIPVSNMKHQPEADIVDNKVFPLIGKFEDDNFLKDFSNNDFEEPFIGMVFQDALENEIILPKTSNTKHKPRPDLNKEITISNNLKENMFNHNFKTQNKWQQPQILKPNDPFSDLKPVEPKPFHKIDKIPIEDYDIMPSINKMAPNSFWNEMNSFEDDRPILTPVDDFDYLNELDQDRESGPPNSPLDVLLFSPS